jgi:hypothetical protein
MKRVIFCLILTYFFANFVFAPNVEPIDLPETIIGEETTISPQEMAILSQQLQVLAQKIYDSPTQAEVETAIDEAVTPLENKLDEKPSAIFIFVVVFLINGLFLFVHLLLKGQGRL